MPIYMQFDGIDGESTAAGFEKAVEVLSVQWGATNPGALGSASGGAGAGKASFEDLHIQTNFQSSSPQLFENLVSGKEIGNATLSFVKVAAGALNTYLMYKLSEVFVTSYETAAAEGSNNDAPTDDIGLAFGQIEIIYSPPNSDGTLATAIQAGWDILRNVEP
ncbi:MAG TPA: type VI secretion system tube protein Hcp [Gaiellaceae bacterium]|nr:type VI secretion system tube protein Hcp [Gaiellaceae bacterium]